MPKDLKVSPAQAITIEEQIRLSSNNNLWHEVRSSRITAHTVFRRQRNFDTLVSPLKKKSGQTRAMREGLEDEPIAAHSYAEVIEKKGNELPCGLVISPFASWITASPDRKIYILERKKAVWTVVNTVSPERFCPAMCLFKAHTK